MRNRILVGLLTAGLVTFGAAPAQASDWEAVSSAHLGSANVRFNGELLGVQALAECNSEELGVASSAPEEIDDVVQFSAGSTSCTRNETTGVARARATGGRFRLDGLRPYGGPLVRMTGYSATCFTTANGASASIQINGLTGLTVPPTIQPNHVVIIPSRTPGARPLARVVLNEKIVSVPSDGSLTVNVMRITLFPQSPTAPLQGDIVVGSVSCAPF